MLEAIRSESSGALIELSSSTDAGLTTHSHAHRRRRKRAKSHVAEAKATKTVSGNGFLASLFGGGGGGGGGAAVYMPIGGGSFP